MVRIQFRVATLVAVALVVASYESGRVRAQRTDGELNQLISQLNEPKTAWAAGARLQKLGGVAAPALLQNLSKHPDAPHGRPNDTMQVLIKIGAPALPYILEEYFRTSDPTGQPPVNRWLLLNILSEIGSPAIPVLVEIAERGGVGNQVSALEFALGRERWPSLERFDDPWWTVDPIRQQRELETNLVPLIPRLKKIMDDGIRHSRPQGSVPQLFSGFALARWGEGETKAQGVQALLGLAQNEQQLFYERQRSLEYLAALGVKQSSELVHAVTPNKTQTDLVDQYRVSAARRLYLLGDPTFFQFVVPLFKSSDSVARESALRLAAQTLDLRFTPELIGRLNDSVWAAGVGQPDDKTRREEELSQILRSLQRITLQSFPAKPEMWWRWWGAHKSITRAQLVRSYLNTRMKRFNSTPYWEMNKWVDGLAGTYDPVILPMIRRYIKHPKLSVRATGPNSFWGSGPNDQWPWSYPPTAVTLLLGLTQKGDFEARRLLYDCLKANDSDVRQVAALAISTFDRSAAIEFLAREMETGELWTSRNAALKLLHLGEERGVPGLIRALQLLSASKYEGLGESVYDDLRRFTQEAIPYDPYGDSSEREAGLQRWWEWWRENERTFKVKVWAAELDRQTLALFRERLAAKAQPGVSTPRQ